MLPALIQLAAILIGYSQPNLRRQYPFMLLSLTAALPIILVPTSRFVHPADWERYIWLPCALVLIFAQSIASLEALFQFGGGARYYNLAPRIAATIGIFAATGAACFLHWPQGDVVGQTVQAATIQRVACTVFLLLSVAFYASVAARDLVSRTEGAHLVLLALWMTLWMIPALRPIPLDWPAWVQTDWMVSARAVVVLLWIAAVGLRRQPLLN